MDRPLELFETFLVGMAVNVVVKLESAARQISREDVEKAWRCVRARHPYLRTVVVRDAANSIAYKPLADAASAPVHIEEIAYGALVQEAQAASRSIEQHMMIQEANKLRDYSVDVAWLAMSTESPQVTRITVNFCHAGIDGPGAFAALHLFLDCLGAARDPASIQSLPLRNVLHTINTELADRFASFVSPTVPENALATAKPPNDFGPLNEAKIRVCFRALSKQETADLIANYRSHGITLQPIASLAGLLAVAQHHKLDITSSAVTPALNFIAKQMRDMVVPPLEPEELIPGGAAVWFWNNLDPKMSLWALAEQGSKEMRAQLASNGHYGMFSLLKTMQGWPAAACFTTNVGINPVWSNYPANHGSNTSPSSARSEFAVAVCEMMGGQNGFVAPLPGIALHFHTVLDALHISASYIHPSFDDHFASIYADIAINALRAMAAGADITMAEFLSKQPRF
eukprot:comp20969_c0_seq1/m.43855 comp20969_c0_seq1/g.43855  ORF comp20969_c0_seq1/g.43855 comp20969_c0_seq1/m.43855 type:complete len:457 (+) comp20969_c0_seq1:13-1383(+)